jgi:ATP-dependent protease ClpP protease subunit
MGSVHYLEDGESGTDHAMAETVIKALHILDNQDTSSKKGEKPINIIMNNIGGDEYHGMAIFDAIENCKNHVTIRVHGHAMSMGSIILQAADERVMTKNSKIMIHYGTFGIYDHSKISYKWTDEGKRFDLMMEDLFLDKIDGRKLSLEKYLTLIGRQEEIPKGNAKRKMVEIDRERLRKMLDYDTFIDAETALELNLIDKIEGQKDY